MLQESIQDARYCLRWKQSVQGGMLHWYLRRFASDLQFWGYVHIRTHALSENRSFDGKFPEDVWQGAVPLLGCIREAGSEGIAPSQYSDGALLVGDAGKGTILIVCNAGDRDHSKGAKAFYSLVDMLQPHVTAAASLDNAT